ncbi:hypothetical protein ACIQU6_19330 [Streptomyces sp. NPDC090442]|uniref:hypothetical protein n=1 Tax=Streptomyces sp. NPDC090442 TaxID=3365962 RepID=UPI00381A3836
MPHRTTLHHARKAAAAAVIAIAAFGLTACQGTSGNGNASSAPSSSSSSPSASADTPQAPASTARTNHGSAKTASSDMHKKSGKKSGTKCTDRINYVGDPRSNAEINSIGENTGHCPAPEKSAKPAGTPKKPGVSCTNQVNYAGDSRSNADINAIGEKTGYCPPVQR